MTRRLSFLCALLCLTACGSLGCGAPATPSSTTSTTRPAVATSASTTSASTATPSSSDVASGTYELHEWGLLRAGPGDVLEVGTVAPAVDFAAPITPMAVEKPVLYFHLDGDAPLALGRASIEAIEGTIREHWPLATARADDAARIDWGPLTLVPERCAFVGPADRASVCASLPPGEVCESLSLARTVTADASCVETASGRSPILFYRSTSRGLTVPIRARTVGGNIEVRNDSDLEIPGRMIRFIESPAGLRVVVVTPPAPHQRVVVGHEDQGTDAARQAIVTTMTGLGLTVSEAGAFLASWEREFFPSAAEDVAEETTREAVATRSARRPRRTRTRSSLLYFLPEALTDRVSRLDFDPAPSATHRALAIWTGVD